MYILSPANNQSINQVISCHLTKQLFTSCIYVYSIERCHSLHITRYAVKYSRLRTLSTLHLCMSVCIYGHKKTHLLTLRAHIFTESWPDGLLKILPLDHVMSHLIILFNVRTCVLVKRFFSASRTGTEKPRNRWECKEWIKLYGCILISFYLIY